MAYKPDSPLGNVRDMAYPSEIAAQRPMMAPRIQCEVAGDYEERRQQRMASIRGDQGGQDYTDEGPTESRSDLFNDRLRNG